MSCLHLLQFFAILSNSWLFTSDLSTYLLAMSPHLNFSLLPSFLLPPSSVSHALFVNLSSHILCTCPAHSSLLPSTFIIRCFFGPVSSLNSPASFCLLVSLYIFPEPSSLLPAASISVSASVSNPYTQAGTNFQHLSL